MLSDWGAAGLTSHGGAWILLLATIFIGILIWVVVTRRRHTTYRCRFPRRPMTGSGLRHRPRGP